MEFVKVMKAKERMCGFYKGRCAECGLSFQNNGKSKCSSFCTQYPQQAEKIILHWEEEHPVQTNADKFKEVFGRTPMACVFEDYDCNCEKCNECYLADFWQQEYKEPKGE